MEAVLLSDDVMEVARVDPESEVRHDEIVLFDLVDRMLSDDGKTTMASSASPPDGVCGKLVSPLTRHSDSVSEETTFCMCGQAHDITWGPGSTKDMSAKQNVGE